MTFHYDPDPGDDVRDELAAEVRSEQARMRRLLAHPDCRDPDHPGCERCREDNDECDH